MTYKEAIRRIENHIEIHGKKEPNAFYIKEALIIALDLMKKKEKGVLIEEVVRCKDCKDYEPHGNGKAGICKNRKCEGLRYATDYCSYGERRCENDS